MHTSIDKLLVTGDSLTDNRLEWIRLLNHHHHWADIVSQQIDAEYVNTGIAGELIKNIADNIQERILQYNPTHVIFDGGINDIERGVEESVVLYSIEFVLIVLYESNIKPIYFVSPAASRTVIETYGSGTLEFISKYIKLYPQILKMMARYKDCEFIDLCTTALGPIYDVDKQYFVDTLHYSQAGESLVAGKMIEHIEKYYSIQDIPENTTSLPQGQILVNYTNHQPLYIKVGSKYKPLVIRNEGVQNTTEAVASIKWRC